MTPNPPSPDPVDVPPHETARHALTLVHLGRAEEALDVVTDALARPDLRLADKPSLRYAAAVVHHTLGDPDKQILAADACLAAARRLEDPGWMANARGMRALAEIRTDRVDAALADLARAEYDLDRTTNKLLVSWAHNALGYCYLQLRLYELAVPHVEQATAVDDPQMSPMAPVIHLLNLAWAHQRWADEIERADPEEADSKDVRRIRDISNRYATRALEAGRPFDGHPMLAEVRAVELVTRPPKLAETSVEELREVWDDPGHVDHIGSRPTVGGALARALWRTGQRDEALEVAREAARLSEEASDWQVTANAQWLLTEMAVEAGIAGATAGRAYGLTLSRALWRQRLATLHGAMAAREVATMQHRVEAAQVAATSDPLTGVANRRALEAMLAAIGSSAQDGPTSMLLIDLDGFKRVNDEHGHHVGDEVLRAVARAIADTARHEDLVVRFGGDEFVVVAADTDATSASILADRVRIAVSHVQVPVDGEGSPTVGVTASVGTRTTGPDLAVEELVAAADRAMYAVKQHRAASDGVT
ncbi:MAG: GGDEF domain-containing protein [Actinomycetota bacterium]